MSAEGSYAYKRKTYDGGGVSVVSACTGRVEWIGIRSDENEYVC